MTQNRTILYWLLLTGTVLLVSMGLLPGQTYARYDTAVGWNTVIRDTQNSVITGTETPILTGDNRTLEFTLSEEVKNPLCTLEVLSADQTFTLYTEDALAGFISGSTVTIQMGDTRPLAGTYRLVITWISEETDTEISETVTFFINFSDC